jgi:hypothetical protein
MVIVRLVGSLSHKDMKIIWKSAESLFEDFIGTAYEKVLNMLIDQSLARYVVILIKGAFVT